LKRAAHVSRLTAAVPEKPRRAEPFRSVRHVKTPALRGGDLTYLHTTSGAAPPDARALFEVTLVDRADKTIVHRGSQQRIRSGEVGLRSPFEVGKLVRRHAADTKVRILALAEPELLEACEAAGLHPRDLRSALSYGRDPRLFAAAASVFEAVESGAPAGHVQTAIARCAAGVVRALSGALRRPLSHRPASARRIREVLHDRLADDLTLDDVASAVSLSRTHVAHVFQDSFHVGPFEYLMKVRVARARELLASGWRPVDVAHACGFCDQSHLNRWFSRAVGVTPGAYAAAVASRSGGGTGGGKAPTTT
jgi:AraC-like DNA-binding protein